MGRCLQPVPILSPYYSQPCLSACPLPLTYLSPCQFTLDVYEYISTKVWQIHFNSESETICNMENSQEVDWNFEVDSVKDELDEKHVDDPSLYDISVFSKNHEPLQCKIDLTEVKQ